MRFSVIIEVKKKVNKLIRMLIGKIKIENEFMKELKGRKRNMKIRVICRIGRKMEVRNCWREGKERLLDMK